MIVGCVREIKNREARVGLTPEGVHELIAHGHQVLIEKDAGAQSGYPDALYAQAGAQIVTAKTVYQEAELVVKVKEPIMEEYDLLRQDSALFTYLHLAADETLTNLLLARHITGIAYETVQNDTGLPLLQPMSMIAGRLSVQEGAKALQQSWGGAGILLSGLPGVAKSQVTILGGGTVGEQAARIALGMGARVVVVDANAQRLVYFDQHFFGRVETRMSSEPVIRELLPQTDLLIASVLVPGASTPKLIRREHLHLMKPGRVIVDVAVDQGGCCETTHATTHDDPVYLVDGIVHYAVANMPGAVARTATQALCNATLPYILMLANEGIKPALMNHGDLLRGLNTLNGSIVCPGVAKALGLACGDAASLLSGLREV